MQAATITAFGDADVLNFGEVPTPSPKPGRALIKIAAVGANYYDTLVRSGAVSRSSPGPSRKPPWPPAGSAVWGRPAARALALIHRSYPLRTCTVLKPGG
jgi:NADPH:quinone reductase-like Zn-dependent oxidoreductase